MGDAIAASRARAAGWRWWRWAGLALVAATILAMFVAGYASSRQVEDAAWTRLHERGSLRVATDASYPPFSAVDANGELFGFDIDLAEAIAVRWGLKASFENLTYDALLGALVAGRDDVVISAFAPQPERTREVAYTGSYFVGGTVGVIRAVDGRQIGADQLAWASGMTLAVEYGAGGDALARRWARRAAGVRVLPQATASEAIQKVAQGLADAALVDAVSAYEFLAAHRGLSLAGPPLEAEPYVIAVGIKSRVLLRELRNILVAMEADGTLPALRVKWFGEAAR